MSTNTNNERKRLNAKNPFRNIEMEPSTHQPQQAIKSYTVNKLSHFHRDSLNNVHFNYEILQFAYDSFGFFSELPFSVCVCACVHSEIDCGECNIQFKLDKLKKNLLFVCTVQQ